MADTLPTTEPYQTTEYDFGKSNSSKKGFQQTSVNLPPAGDVWGEYFWNVMRGDTDSLGSPLRASDGPPAIGDWVGENRTFSEPDSSGERPPQITAYEIVGGTITPGTDGGAPDGGFVPTVASPGEGNGTNAGALEGLGGLLVTKLISIGSNAHENGSNISPATGASCQTNQDSAQDGVSPSYTMGMYGWSDGVSPKPGSS